MTAYYDQHLHTHHSYDSEAEFSEYLAHTTGYVVTTEHFDVANPVTGQTDAPDYAQYVAEIDRLNQRYQGRVLKGIEIGYYHPKAAEILAYLADKSYDLKLLSVHHNGAFDYLDDFVAAMDFDDVFGRYLAELEQAIEQNDQIQAHVLAHFDYGIRLFDVARGDLERYEQRLIEIFQKMIDADLAFEINAKSTHLYGHLALYAYAIELIQKLGGTLFTLGSDGHKLAHYELGFDELKPWLKAQGINQLVTFRAGKRYFVTI
ncbi:MAG: PHP domain-containing protein [Streptococcaceae bacterium]|jgi:histidinol-phosphatase (PHP family)|nr:PHP domain-containing protein [Streptococcaceae bacterium]